MQMNLIASESYVKRDDNKYEKGKHFVGISMRHFEFCPKYRYKMFAKFKIQEYGVCLYKKSSIRKQNKDY